MDIFTMKVFITLKTIKKWTPIVPLGPPQLATIHELESQIILWASIPKHMKTSNSKMYVGYLWKANIIDHYQK